MPVAVSAVAGWLAWYGIVWWLMLGFGLAYSIDVELLLPECLRVLGARGNHQTIPENVCRALEIFN